jgi:hypothetical protein
MHNGGIDHRVLVVRILCQGFKQALPYARPTPTRVTGVHDSKIAKAGWQVTPGDACRVAVQHGVNEQSVIFDCSARLTGQKGLDEFPLGIKQGVSFTHSLYMGLRQHLSTIQGL